MKNEMKKLNFEELNQISGGTTAENAELLEIIQANPELNRIYNNGLKFHDGNVRHAIEYVIYHSDLSNILFDVRKEKNPCSLCANLRRGMLNTIAIEHGCNKVALGHHLDDVIETLFMNMCLNGNIHTFSPVTTFGRQQITIIRPMIYVYEKETRALARKMNFPVMGKCCPKDGFTMRQYFKDTITQFRKDIPKVRENLIGAVIRSNIPGWDKTKINTTPIEEQDEI